MSTLKIHKKSRFQPNEKIFAESCSVRYKDLFRAQKNLGVIGTKIAYAYAYAYDTKKFISLFERAFKLMKNGVCFIVIALVVA